MNQSIEEFLKEEPGPIMVVGDRRLYWNGHEWAVIRVHAPLGLPLNLLYEGPLLSEALTCLRTGERYWRKDEINR